MSARAAVLALPALLLGACGGSSDEDKIRAIVKEGSTSPASVCDHLTDPALKDLGGKDACIKLSQSQDNTDPNAKVDDVAVDGDKATVKLTGKDGAQTIRFVKQDGEWKVSPG